MPLLSPKQTLLLERAAARLATVRAGFERLWRLIWRREVAGFMARFAVSAVLVAVSAPRLTAIFERVNSYGPGVVFEVSMDCDDADLSVEDDLTVDGEGAATGSVLLNWGPAEGCTMLHVGVPASIIKVETGHTLYAAAGDHPDPAVRVTDQNVRIDVPLVRASGFAGVKITFDGLAFVQPVTFVDAVTQTSVRAVRAPENGWKLPQADFERQFKVLKPAFHSRITLPYRFAVVNALVKDIGSEALDRGSSRIDYEGSGIITLQDREHAERKDRETLVYGTLLATGLAMLAEFVCKCVEAFGSRGAAAP